MKDVSVAGVADPGRRAERLSERIFGRGRRPDTNQWIPMRILKDFCVAGVADPGRGAERLSERFFSRGRRPDSN